MSRETLLIIMATMLGAVSEDISLMLSGHVVFREYRNGKNEWSSVAKSVVFKMAVVGFVVGLLTVS